MNWRPWLTMVVWAALIAGGAQVEVPLGEVPFVLSDFFVLLGGLVLGPWRGAGAVALYLLAGALGLPVFAGGAGGWAHLIGPTGGYLLGFLLAPLVVGGLARGPQAWWRCTAAVASGQVTFFLLGLTWLYFTTDMTAAETVAAGLAPFWLAIAVKMVTAGTLGWWWKWRGTHLLVKG